MQLAFDVQPFPNKDALFLNTLPLMLGFPPNLHFKSFCVTFLLCLQSILKTAPTPVLQNRTFQSHASLDSAPQVTHACQPLNWQRSDLSGVRVSLPSQATNQMTASRAIKTGQPIVSQAKLLSFQTGVRYFAETIGRERGEFNLY